MRETLIFDYYYGKEAEQFSFYRIPRMLIKDAHFSSLSNDAKILYGLMLDRMSLSVRNGWQDDDDRTYIIYTIDNIMEDLNCAKGKAVRTLAELDSENGIGLIEKKRVGLGKPDIIYVKNFVGIAVNNYEEESNNIEYDYSVDECEDTQIMADKPRNYAEVPKSNFKKSQNQTSRGSNTELQEVSKSNLKRSQNKTSGGFKTEPQEVSNWNPNYTEYNQNYGNYTETNYTECNYTQVSNESYPIYPCEKYGKRHSADKMDVINETCQYIKSIIDYDVLISTEINGVRAYDKQLVDELVNVMVSAITSDKQYLSIGGEAVPIQQVKSRFEKYNMSIMEYVITCLKENTTKVKNIKKYMLAVLFNAPMTINMYYQSEVNHDLYGIKGE